MSEEDVQVVRRGLEAWMRGDLEGLLETTDPAIGWDISTHPLPDVPNQGRGREAFATELLATYRSGWNDYSAELNEVLEVGEDVLVVLHETATMRDTGVPLERDLVQVWTVRSGKAVFLRVFQTKADALEAAGPSE
jgi:ketosteroid isomerase-like protein